MKFIISVSNLNDAITMKEWEVVDSYARIATDFIKNGGQVVFQQDFVNSEPIIFKTIKSLDEIECWKSSMNQIIKCIHEGRV